MCGIIGSISKKPTLNNAIKVVAQYSQQDHRGKQGYGFVAVKDGEIVWAKSKTENEIMQALGQLGETTLIMFHHRIPTCNYNTVKANHPLLIASKKNLKNKYYIIHNGHIQNSDSLRKIHEENGFKYRSEVSFKYYEKGAIYSQHTDTESLGIEMARFIEGKSSRIRARGGAAIFMLETDRNDNALSFYYFRDGNPIKWFRNQHSLFLASESMGQELPEEMLYKLDLSTWQVTAKKAVLSVVENIGETTLLPPLPFNNLIKTKKVVDVRVHGNPPMVILPKPYVTPIGFHRLKTVHPQHDESLDSGRNSMLGMSIRTHKSLETNLETAEANLYDSQTELFSYVNMFGEKPDDVLRDLENKVDRRQKIVDIIKTQISNIEDRVDESYAWN